MIKLICKDTGKEVTRFSVINRDVGFSRHMASIGEGTVIEFDREYVCGGPIEVYYEIKGSDKEFLYKIDRQAIEDSSFVAALCSENMKFDVTPKMILESRSSGPFIIEGRSRVVTIS